MYGRLASHQDNYIPKGTTFIAGSQLLRHFPRIIVKVGPAFQHLIRMDCIITFISNSHLHIKFAIIIYLLGLSYLCCLRGVYEQYIQIINRMSQVLSSNIGMSAEAYVSGAQRLNFIKKPLVATMNDVPLHLQPPVQEINPGQFQSSNDEEIIESKVKDVEVQTDYRDSTAQTDPYSPEEIYREGERPEVLMLKNLKYGKGLPASIEELDQIELNREKQWFENCLPPISDEASFNLRRKLMEEQELREWSKKEDEIKKLHHEGLELVKKGLIEREKDVEEKNSQRIEDIKIRMTEEKNRLIAKIQRKKIKILRKFTKARKDEDDDGNKRDIIEEYANFASRVYAGITRQGLSLDKIANKYEVQPMALNTYEGLMNINTGEDVKPKRSQPQYTRLQTVHKKALDVAQSQIDKKLKPSNQKDKDVPDDIQHLRNVIARPPTPNMSYDQNFNIVSTPKINVPMNAIKEDSNGKRNLSKREVAILFLQRILRGRAQQNFMYEGKEKRLALIEELLIVAKIPNLPENEAEEILIQEHEEKLKNALLEGLQGQAIAQTLDALSKQLLRTKQQNKIAKLVQTAQNDRRNRQIDQAGKRNAERIIRQRQQYLYNQIARMNQGTVDTYLDWIINNTVDKASTRQASIMATLRKTEMNVPLEGFERRFNNNQTVIRDLVQSFLLPNIQRSKLMKKVQLEERRFKEASKKSVQTTLTRVSAEIMENRQ